MSVKEHKECQVWVAATIQCLQLAQKPLHTLEIKRLILEKALIPPGIETPLENALSREVSLPTRRLKTTQGKVGVFELVAGNERPVIPKARPVPHNKSVIPTRVKTEVNKTHGSIADKYKARYKRLRKSAKDLIFTNAAICDEVGRLEEKIARAKQERKFLLKRLMQHQSIREITLPSASQAASSTATVTQKALPGVPTPVTGTPCTEKVKVKKKTVPKKALMSKEVVVPAAASETTKTKPSKKVASKSTSIKKLVEPIPLDSTGRPVFPIVLGELTVHSVGEVITDKPDYHSAESIFPIGYCSTRVYASITDPNKRCLYTCKISDIGEAPLFEISPDDQPGQVLQGAEPSECHQKLLHLVNAARGAIVVNTLTEKGAQFFGLTHPCIQNLIQSCPGARKCSQYNYKWVKFEIAKPSQSVIHTEDDPCISFEALQRSVSFQQARLQSSQRSAPATPISGPEVSASLRSLLTNAQYMQQQQQLKEELN